MVPLGSGSRGNATLVELGGRTMLVDAGLSARTLEARLRGVGVDPAEVSWILLSHEHQDHTRGAERLSRRYGIPVVSSQATLAAMDRSPRHFAGWRPLPDDGLLELDGLRVDGFPVPHDAAAPVGYVLHGEGMRVGLVTDLGHATTLVVERLRGCQALLVEANHDSRMLQDGPYPWHLKQRVGGRLGHLSNLAAASLLERVVDGECRALVLGHLSEKNNRPELARREAGRALAAAGAGRVTLRIAAPRAATPEIRL